uniref:Uncharacterized protein n=1 Tax=Arundo donax TaxID=35708 RepID=A0A0A8YGC3_ARUDO
MNQLTSFMLARQQDNSIYELIYLSDETANWPCWGNG